MLPLAFQHGHLRVFGYRIGGLAYITDVKSIPDAERRQLQGLDVLVLNALWWRPHPTHLSIGEAIETAQALGARRTYLTHLTHETGHAELAGAAARGHLPRVRRAHRGGRVIRLAYGRMLQDGLDGTHGLPRARLAELAAGFGAVQAEVRRRRAAGEYGFYKLVDQSEPVREISAFAEGLGQAHDHVLVLGIGGSALGARALLTALRRPAWNEWDDEGREFFPRLTVLDNVDPTTIGAALRRIDPRRVLVNVISKSGGTAETMAQYLVVRAWLEEALGAAAYRHLVFTTDPERGALREIAARDGIATLSVPPDVGGRFSVLSPVGLAARGPGGHRHRGAARGRAAGGRARRGRRPAARTRPRSTPRSTGPPTPTSAPASTCSCPTPTACGSSPSGTGSSGPRAWASGWIARGARSTAGPRRWRPSAPPTSTARCSSSWKGRSTR